MTTRNVSQAFGQPEKEEFTDVQQVGSERYVLGLDLGQAADPTALVGIKQWQEKRFLPKTGIWQTVKRYALRGLRRWPIRTPYPAIVHDVAETVAKEPLQNCVLGIDLTGVGRPVYDLFVAKKPKAQLRPVLITAGHKFTFDDGIWHVAKVSLVSACLVALQSRLLELPRNIPDVDVLEKELVNFRVKATLAGNEVYEHRDGENDDIVLALCIAVFLAEKSPPRPPMDPPSYVPHTFCGLRRTGYPPTLNRRPYI